MPIISWPEDVTPLEEAECVICFQLKPVSDLTICFSTPNPHQLPAFLCTAHFWKTHQLILGLADHFILESQPAAMKNLILQYRHEQQAKLKQEIEQQEATHQSHHPNPQHQNHQAESDALVVR